MSTLRKAWPAIAVTAAALTLSTGTAGAATSPHHAAPSTCFTENVGNQGVYKYQGVLAGYVNQVYNNCGGGIGVTFTWDSDFALNHPGAYVDLYVSSPWSSSRGAETWYYGRVTDATPNWIYYNWYSPALLPSSVAPDDFRAGAEINSDNCWEWTSLHYYGNGSEWDANPFGGCGDPVAPI